MGRALYVICLRRRRRRRKIYILDLPQCLHLSFDSKVWNDNTCIFHNCEMDGTIPCVFLQSTLFVGLEMLTTPCVDHGWSILHGKWQLRHKSYSIFKWERYVSQSYCVERTWKLMWHPKKLHFKMPSVDIIIARANSKVFVSLKKPTPGG
jgi:hypothetical protein